MKPYSKDLRLKVLEAVDRGMPRREVAQIFGVSVPAIKRWLKRRRETGEVAAILTCPRFDAPWADQTGSTSSPHMRIMRYGSCPLKPAVGRALEAVGRQDAWGWFTHCG